MKAHPRKGKFKEECKIASFIELNILAPENKDHNIVVLKTGNAH